jgi:hypothetical protein
MLKSAGFEMAQMVWYRGSGVTVQEQGEKGHSPQHIVERGNKLYCYLGLLIELGCRMIHGAPCWQLQLLKFAKKHQFHLKVVRGYGVVALTGRPAVHRAKPACEEELQPAIPRVLQGDVRRVLQGEGIGWNDHAAILHIQGYLRLSLSDREEQLKIKGYPNLSLCLPADSLHDRCAWAS